jgi:hypothetical protein
MVVRCFGGDANHHGGFNGRIVNLTERACFSGGLALGVIVGRDVQPIDKCLHRARARQSQLSKGVNHDTVIDRTAD